MADPVQLLSPGVAGFEKTPATNQENLSPAKMASVGWTEKGPSHTPIEVGSVEDYERTFGPISNLGVTPIMVRGFFDIGGEEAIIVRVTPADSVAAAVDIDAPAKYTFTLLGEGIYGNDYQIRVRGNRNFIDRTAGAEKWDKYDVLVLTPFGPDPSQQQAEETFEAVQFSDPTAAGYVVDVITDPTLGSQITTIAEVLGGDPAGMARTDVSAEAVTVGDGTLGPYTGTLALGSPLSGTVVIYNDRPVVASEGTIGVPAAGTNPVVAGTLVDGPSAKRGSVAFTYTADLGGGGGSHTVTDDPTSEDSAGTANLIDDFDGSIVGTVNYDTRAYSWTTATTVDGVTAVLVGYTPQYFARDGGVNFFTFGDIDPSATNTINYETGAFALTWDDDAAATKGGPFPDPIAASTIAADYVNLPQFVDYDFAGGLNGTAVSRAAISDPALEASERGIYALDKYEQPLNMIVPDFEGSQNVQADVIAFAEARLNDPYKQKRHPLLGFANGTSRQEAVNYVLVTQAGVFDTKVAAIFYNNMRYRRSDGLVQTVPITGFIAGCYARAASKKNVGRVPAGIDIGQLEGPGMIGPEFRLSRTDQNALFQARINPCVRSDATGFILNGDRLLSTQERWRFINARTLHDFLFFRIGRLLQFAVFENNGPSLWLKADETVRGFMLSLFRLGYFGGSTPDQAFFVKVDATNNTRGSNQLNVAVGFSPGIPAEFVVFTLEQPVQTTAPSTNP